MKKIFFPAMAAMALGLASCSSDEPTSNGGGVDLSKGGYVKLSINLPTAKSSRAANDNFDDGMAKEYSVKNAQLILFTGTSEANATFHSAYNLATSMEMENPANNQITSTTRVVEKTETNTTGDHLYALVILNNNGETTVTDNALSVNGTNFTGTFTALAQALSTTDNATPKFASDVTNKGIFMANAPLASVAGGTVEPTGASIATLTDVTSNVYSTEAEAQSHPSANIYVERGVAKVTFSKNSSGSDHAGNATNNGTGELTGDEFNTNKVSYEILGWTLDVTNKKSYLVRQTSTDWNLLNSTYATTTGGDKYRFIGGTAVAPDLYRTYWATDPNYSTYVDGDFYTQQNTLPTLSNKFEDENPQYCYENTFNVDNMNQNQTTRAVVSVQLYIDAAKTVQDLYIFNGDRTKLYSKTDCYARIKTAVAHALEGTANANPTINDDDITLKVKAGSKDECTYEVGEVKVGSTYTLSASELAYVNNEVKDITMYKNGVAYYPIRIKHFGDDSTPWNVSGQGVTAATIYPTANKDDNFLGRYGVLRNNWYNIAVTKIAGVGTPSIPETDETTDDELSSYIAVRINILSWAKRQQNADL